MRVDHRQMERAGTSSTRGSRGRAGGWGFTLLELIIVVAIVGILATIAMPALKNVPRRASEAVLQEDLRAFRDVIDQFYADKGHYPPSLEALVEEGYFRVLPMDPITKSTETWQPVFEEFNPDEEPAETDLPEDGQAGIFDVKSGSDETALDGTPYSDW